MDNKNIVKTTKTEEHQPEFLAKQLERLVNRLEALRVADYMELLERPARLIFTNFVAGIARGLGIAIGASLVFALLLSFLKRLILLNIPGIGGFIADILQIIETRKGTF
ncbi:hypothetical protein SCACP_18270 [Sporomusa carbonis]|uniref:DUF5665 domain-containing protein n=1 Tax=Sporomusa carbonis TaxID=3076075 RepID=UPI003A656E40